MFQLNYTSLVSDYLHQITSDIFLYTIPELKGITDIDIANETENNFLSEIGTIKFLDSVRMVIMQFCLYQL